MRPTVAPQDGEQLFVGTKEKDLIASREARTTTWWVLEWCSLRGSTDRNHPCSRGEITQLESLKAARRRDLEASDQEGLILEVKGLDDIETEGSADDGAAEYLFRLAGPMGVYGGTLEVFRNMIAQHRLGLGRPNYSPPAGSSA